jgi:hypothetical protein
MIVLKINCRRSQEMLALPQNDKDDYTISGLFNESVRECEV